MGRHDLFRGIGSGENTSARAVVLQSMQPIRFLGGSVPSRSVTQNGSLQRRPKREVELPRMTLISKQLWLSDKFFCQAF
jgi:hypothetical protein